MECDHKINICECLGEGCPFNTFIDKSLRDLTGKNKWKIVVTPPHLKELVEMSWTYDQDVPLRTWGEVRCFRYVLPGGGHTAEPRRDKEIISQSRERSTKVSITQSYYNTLAT